ncbi:PEP-CTERM sorting domain-containing protein [Pseudoduganella lutea]|uniref:PEP-CTERM sorting domain-containing protein n=2 Tax=Pseudoduganella lutea TaxID=321985 RepID=A0A4V0Z4N9_9BURK|nr:PEP-CTERM sorting domain-containing protein [Pseudoduganella lutea]
MGMENQSYAADSTFKFADLTPGVERQTSIARLYGLYYDKITGADEASKDLSLSFQLALWELYNDDATFETAATGKLAVNNTITGGRGNGAGGYAGAAPIVTDAYKMLAEAKDKSLAYTQQYTFTRYTSGTSQDFVIAQAVSAVPEPSTYAMLGLGLAVVGFAARRRAKR